MTIALYSELVDAAAAGMLFPVNELRNMATLPARAQLLCEALVRPLSRSARQSTLPIA